MHKLSEKFSCQCSINEQIFLSYRKNEAVDLRSFVSLSDLLLKWQIVEQVIQKKSFYLYFLVENRTSCIIYEGTIFLTSNIF